MDNTVPLQLPSHAFLALAAYLQESGSGAGIEELAATAIAEWVVQARARARTGGPTQGRGYQWKELFLPSGSRLRMCYAGRTHHAEVQGDEIIFDGRTVSPAQMANTIAAGTRNAWRDLWIICPGETAWKLASVRRRQSRQIESALAAPRPAPCPAAPSPAAPAPAEALLRRLALLLEQTLDARKPQYRRRTDVIDDD
jgi:hypothetical protein